MGCRKSKCCYTPVAAVPGPQPPYPSMPPMDPTFGGIPGMPPFSMAPPFPQIGPAPGPLGGFPSHPEKIIFFGLFKRTHKAVLIRHKKIHNYQQDLRLKKGESYK
ncbi:hypothetical protein BpHYR1_019431 [Brachionus plicatilis]|uniref:Uncharacterized protein n=1 Tax=Brachionus plicatilis TaxID=10195 RepID=A0A3M7PDQ5_BRAPC|nr:hypothetical protein BpHYR1_019431 [Brachionus plicatilis]